MGWKPACNGIRKLRCCGWRTGRCDSLRRRSPTTLPEKAPAKEIREKLEVRVVGSERWNGWWKKVQSALKGSSQFYYDSRSSPQTYRLRVKPEEVDVVSLGDLRPPARARAAKSSPMKRLTDWVIWIQADEPGPMPAGTSGPPEELIQVIESASADITPRRAVERLAAAIEERVLSAKNLPKATSLYLDCLVAGLDRWNKCPDAPDMPVAEIATMAARLLEVSDENEHEGLIIWLGNYVSKGGDNAGIVNRRHTARFAESARWHGAPACQAPQFVGCACQNDPMAAIDRIRPDPDGQIANRTMAQDSQVRRDAA